MARDRSTRQIAKRIDLTYFKRGHPYRRWKRNLSIAAAVLAAGWPAAMAWRGDQTIYSGGDLSIRHAMLGDDCRQCHTSGWGERYANPVEWNATLDRACLACHPAPAHHANQTSLLRDSSAATCTTCHVEHRGHDELALLTSRHCIQCHADLKKSAVPDLHADGCPVAPDHQIHAAVSGFEEGHPEFAVHGRLQADRTRLQFNHFAHLYPDTPGKLAMMSRNLEGLAGRPGIGRDVGKRLRLECGYCHQSEASGAYMKPVQYETHCRDCHPIASPGIHDRPALVRDSLRSWLLDHAPKEGDPRGWVAAQLRERETALYTSECSKCHAAELGGELPVVAPTGIEAGRPRRWLVHSRFDHNAHRELACTQCHFAAPQSRKTADVLLPRRADCVNCHSKGGGARTTCVECHDYHDHRKDAGFEGSMRIGWMRESKR